MVESTGGARLATGATIFDEAPYLTDAYAPTRKSTFERDDEHLPRIKALKETIDSVTLDVLEWALEAASIRNVRR